VITMDNCPTCVLLDALLQSRGINKTQAAVAYSPPVRALDRAAKRKVKRGATTASRKLGKALKKVNAKARTKSGKFKKGWTQTRVMKEAHKMKRRM